MCRCSLRQLFNFNFIKEKVENVCSTFTNHNIWIVAISISLKKFRSECLKMQETFNVHQSCVKGLRWNAAFIATTTLDFMVILNMLDYISKPHVDKMWTNPSNFQECTWVQKFDRFQMSLRAKMWLDQLQMMIKILLHITLKPILWITISHNVHDIRCWKTWS
jgi:hypothetical protein